MTKPVVENNPLTRPLEGPIARWSPFEEMNDLRHRMEELFARSFGYTPLSRLLPGEPVIFEPAVDIYETPEAVDFYAALPGFTLDSIKVEATPDTVVLEAERKPLYPDKATVYRQGWVAVPASFRGTYSLPAEIVPGKVKATFTNGVLHLAMTKTEGERSKGVKVSISGA